jgi:hypothetical protein
MRVGADDDFAVLQVENLDDAGDGWRGLEFPVGVEEEALSRLVEDDAPAGPVFVFVVSDQGGECGYGRAAAPGLPDVDMCAAIGEAVSVGFCFGEGAGFGEDAAVLMRV